jgi:hypothetical protein
VRADASQSALGSDEEVEQGISRLSARDVAFYGPDDRRASKVAVGIVPKEGAEATELERWFSDHGDVRDDPDLINAITRFLEGHAVKSVILADRILGCPHEEGVDYPLGEKCPVCPFWANRDRWTSDGLH